MAARHRAYPDLIIENNFATDPDQDAESSIQLIERKINFFLEMHLEMLVNWQTRHSGRKRCSLVYSEVQLLVV